MAYDGYQWLRGEDVRVIIKMFRAQGASFKWSKSGKGENIILITLDDEDVVHCRKKSGSAYLVCYDSRFLTDEGNWIRYVNVSALITRLALLIDNGHTEAAECLVYVHQPVITDLAVNTALYYLADQRLASQIVHIIKTWKDKAPPRPIIRPLKIHRKPPKEQVEALFGDRPSLEHLESIDMKLTHDDGSIVEPGDNEDIRPYHDIQHLTIDTTGYVYWKGQHIEHHDLPWGLSEEGKREAQELLRRCQYLEANGRNINGATVIWTWSDPEGWNDV